MRLHITILDMRPTLHAVIALTLSLSTSLAFAETPDLQFQKFMSTRSPLARLYQTLSVAGFIAGLSRSSESAKCPKALNIDNGDRQGPFRYEYILIEAVCSVENGNTKQAQEKVGQLRTAQQISFRPGQYDFEYVQSAFEVPPDPIDIFKIIGLSTDRPIVALDKLSAILLKANADRVLSDYDLVKIGQAIEAGGSDNDLALGYGALDVVLGLRLQATGYRNCASTEPCKSYFSKTKAKWDAQKQVSLAIGKRRSHDAQDVMSLFLFPNLGAWWVTLQVAVISAIPPMRDWFEQRILQTHFACHYNSFFHWASTAP